MTYPLMLNDYTELDNTTCALRNARIRRPINVISIIIIISKNNCKTNKLIGAYNKQIHVYLSIRCYSVLFVESINFIYQRKKSRSVFAKKYDTIVIPQQQAIQLVDPCCQGFTLKFYR